MIENYTKQIIPIFLIISLYLCCSSDSGRDEIVTHQVQKKQFVNKITATGFIEATKTLSISCPPIWTDATIIYLIPEGTNVQKGDTVCILEASEIENKYKEAVKDLENAEAEYQKSVVNLNLQYLLLNSKVKSIETQTAIAHLDSTQLAFSSPYRQQLIQFEMKKAELEKEKLQNKLKFLKIINEFELRKLKKKIEQAKNKMAREKEKLDKLTLKANTSGMLIYKKLWTSGIKVREGDIVWANMPIAEIPDMSEMQVRLLVNETKFKRIENEQAVHIVIDAFPEIQLTGKIIKKAPMGKPIKKESKVKYFEISASIDSSGFKIEPGLSVTCDVIIESLPDTVVVPLFTVFEKDSLKVVYIKRGKKYVRQPVQIATSSENYAVISEGLEGNEQIAMSIPFEASIKPQRGKAAY